MRIGELANACDCPVATIRYYEKFGLLPADVRKLLEDHVHDEPMN